MIQQLGAPAANPAGQAVGQTLANMLYQPIQQQDTMRLMQWLQAGGTGPPPVTMSPLGQQLGAHLAQAQLGSQLPLGQMEQSEVAKNQAMAQLYGQQAAAVGQPQMPSPADLKAQEMMRIDAELRQMEAKGETDTPRFEFLQQARARMFGYDDDPNRTIARMKLDAIRSTKPGSAEQEAALGVRLPDRIPAKFHDIITQGLAKIAEGEDPEIIYRHILRNHPDMRQYTRHLDQILRPSKLDLLDVIMGTQIQNYLRESP